MPINVSALMKTSVISTTPEATLEEVINVLSTNKISGLPVVDPDNKVIGIITEKVILEFSGSTHAIPLIGSSGWISPHTDVTTTTSFKKGYELLSNFTVDKVMASEPISVKKDMSIAKVANLMKKVNHIPVVDEEGKLIGIISRSDLVDYLVKREN